MAGAGTMPPLNLTGGTSSAKGQLEATFRGGGINITKGMTGTQILIGGAVLVGGFLLLKMKQGGK
jgi:hypothetical protein